MGGMNNEYRRGHFTSSNAYKLLTQNRKKDGFGSPALTYIKEKQLEIRMNTCLDGGAYTQALAWGNFIETRVYNVLGLNYKIASKDTVLHPKYGGFWSGSVDLYTVDEKGNKTSVAEIKCYQKKNFALYSDCLLQKDIELFKKDFPKEYWQIVSNAIIHNVGIGEAIVYMPYVSEAKEIREMVDGFEGAELWQYRFIQEREIEDLPFLPDGGYYKNMCRFSFIVPEEDMDYLTKRMIEANKLLTETK